jgi:hypothetical protein
VTAADAPPTESGSTGFQAAGATALWALDSGAGAHYVISGFLRVGCPARWR